MIFNSLTFFIFFIIFFILYWFVLNKKLANQNILLLIGSYFFYIWADWRLLSYLILISFIFYVIGLEIEKEENSKRSKILLNIGLFIGVGGLVYFKYFNFFIESFNDLFHSLGVSFNLKTLNILVPVGISFFTFRLLSYIIDIDRGKIKATKDWVVFFNYVSFFPSLLSGPIDKAKLLVPQLEKRRKFEYTVSTDGLRQILWGMFKKIVIADNLALLTNDIFDNYSSMTGSALLIGAFFYAIQLYTDFSGYSDMAIGFAKLLGFKITKNFDFPFFAQNIAEFWRKWHISLTSWLTEYVFTPLSIKFRDYGKYGMIMAIVINFVIVGIWHGANWTYVLFGFLHGLYFIPVIINGGMTKKKNSSKLIPAWKDLINMLFTFTLVMLTFVVFRSTDIAQAKNFLFAIFSKSLFTIPQFKQSTLVFLVLVLLFIFILFEWFNRNEEYTIASFGKNWKRPVRWAFYSIIIFLIGMYMPTKELPFIYFQF